MTRVLTIGAGLFGVLLTLTACEASPKKRSVILTTDVGCEVDDQWAMVALLRSRELETLGIVTTHAPNLEAPAAEFSAGVARDVISRLELDKSPPVFAGSSDPLESNDRPRRNVGVDFIVESARGFDADNRLVVVTLGATTDVASALLVDGGLADRIEVVTMGFMGWPGGEDPWNIKNDAHAYRAILASGVPITVGSAEVCQLHLTVERDDLRAQTRGLGVLGEFLRDSSLRWIDEHIETCRKYTGREAWVLWDLVTVGHLLGMTTVEHYPRPDLDDDLRFVFPPEDAPKRPPIGWMTALDAKAFWKDFRQKNILRD